MMAMTMLMSRKSLENLISLSEIAPHISVEEFSSFGTPY
jgi:hypothetical protein